MVPESERVLRLAEALRALSVESRRVRDRVAHQLGLRIPEVGALLMLGRTGRTTIKPLVVELRLTSGAVTALLDRMESVDLVRREGNPDDRRSVFVRLTANGESIRAEFVERVVDHVAQAIELQPDLGDPRLPDRLDQVTQALRAISAEEPEGAPRE